MIELINICKSFPCADGEVRVLNSINYVFEENGLYIIEGPSGCGKTTLLNMIAEIDDLSSGMIIKDKDLMLNDNMRYMKQGFGLLNRTCLYDNVSLLQNKFVPFSAKCHLISNFFLKLFNIHRSTSEANLLSGGEQQRGSLSTVLADDARALLLDEPTSNLDLKNKEIVLNAIKEYSLTHLVIVVTHDIALFADIENKTIIQMRDGKFIDDCGYIEKERPTVKSRRKKGDFFRSLLIVFKTIFITSGRTMLFCTISSIYFCLFLVICSLLSSISNNISKQFSENLYENKITMVAKNEICNEYNSLSIESLSSILETTDLDGYSLGYYYDANFENIFKTQNKCVFTSLPVRSNVLNLSSRSFNNYQILRNEVKVYPNNYELLSKTEFVLGLNKEGLYEITQRLSLKNNYETLGDYIKSNNLPVSFILKNNEYGYDEEFLFEIVGVCESNNNVMFHREINWNVWFYEEVLSFAVQNSFTKTLNSVNELRKYCYVQLAKKEDIFTLEKLSTFNNFVFENINNLQYEKRLSLYSNRYLPAISNNDPLIYDRLDEINSSYSALSDYRVTYETEYMNLSNSGLTGFTGFLFFSKSIDILQTMEMEIENLEDVELLEYQQTNVLTSNIMNLNLKNMIFKPVKSLMANQLGISKKAAETLQVIDGQNVYLLYKKMMVVLHMPHLLHKLLKMIVFAFSKAINGFIICCVMIFKSLHLNCSQ